MSLFAKARKAKENKKGFTLVELIVVLVILAILAAILVPALLGWIDEAKKKQYVLEARSIYMAAQAVADEGYAAQALDDTTTYSDLSAYLTANVPRIQTLSDLTGIKLSVGTVADPNDHQKYTIDTMKVEFNSASGETAVRAELAGGTWTVALNGDPAYVGMNPNPTGP